jgi:hypothetical protein
MFTSGAVPSDVNSYSSGATVTVANNSGILAKTGYTFGDWCTTQSVAGDACSETSRAVASTFTITAATTLYAQWTLAAPAFTLSSSSESKAQNVTITGYTIVSTGGTVASYAISPAAPAGLTFSTSSGLLSGTPTTVQSATEYTITATNATSEATQKFTLTVTALVTCATGGVCAVGDTGPGGGIVFYVRASGMFNCGVALTSTCKYLEAAPTLGTALWADAGYFWSGNINTLIGADAQGVAIGTGLKNTEAMRTQSGGGDTAGMAGTITRAYRGPNDLTDWYLPSQDELNQMCKWQRGQEWVSDATICNENGNFNLGPNASGFFTGAYWSSSENVAAKAWYQFSATGGQGNFDKNSRFYVRPVRAFG